MQSYWQNSKKTTMATAQNRTPPEHTYKLTWKCELNPHNLKSYLGNPNIKADGVSQEFTQWEYDEFRKCKNDPIYFVENYVKVINSGSKVNFIPYPYQRRLYDIIKNNRFIITLQPRQSGKSTSFVTWFLWFAIFHPYQRIAIAAHKKELAKELLSRIMLALENLPFFLQPGVKKYNTSEIEFSTDTKIQAFATSSSGLRGFSPTVCFLDEFAAVQNAEKFYTSTYPSISAGKKSKIIIVSTADGVNNKFYDMWQGALQKTNLYVPVRVDWWEVPGRDEKWKADEIANTSPLQFAQEHGNEFSHTSSTLISGVKLMEMDSVDPIDKIDNVRIYDHPEEDHKYVMTVDCSKGRGLDASAFSVFDVTRYPIKQVAAFSDNEMSPLVFPEMINKIGKYYNDAYCVVEANDIGQMIYNILSQDLGYPNLFSQALIKGETFGLEMTKKVKSVGCSNFKDLLESNKLVVHDKETIREITVFEISGSSYAARKGYHDDLTMTLVSFSWLTAQPEFEYVVDDNIREMFEKQRKEVEESAEDVLGEIPDTEYDFVLEDTKTGNLTKFKYDESIGVIIDTEESGCGPVPDTTSFLY